ncbi:DEAD/DEAH box helicase [Siccirubricoccus phaeus]|uniref:DEAD/DEAH box helicase n=1 Tax=Siccirubricoccus phaeus TaxID=2595053 RepID=UPI0011F1B546|nr:DEAD/DEAH box helicase [Siccirubricoccus phaeus]
MRPTAATPPACLARLNPNAMERLLGRNAMAAGQAYLRQGRVLGLEFAEDGETIHATTRGSAQVPYRQEIAVSRPPGGSLRIIGDCTCPVGHNCKHVAAALLAARQQLVGLRPPPSRAPQPAAPPPAPVLPGDIALWLQALSQAVEGEDYPPNLRNRLFYVLHAPPEAPSRLRIEAWSATLRKDDSLGEPRRLGSFNPATPPRHFRPSDRWLMPRLARLAHRLGDIAADEAPEALLRRAIATGRARWGSVDGPAVTEGPPRRGRLGWALRPDGHQQPELVLEPGLLGLRLPAPWYAAPETGVLGPVELAEPPELARQLLAAPPIPPNWAARVREELGQRLLPDRPLPLPATLPEPELVCGPPRPVLRLTGIAPPYHFGGGFGPARPVLPVARLGFGYGPFRILRGETVPEIQGHAGRLYRVRRDRGAELAAERRLGTHGFASLARLRPYLPASQPDFVLSGEGGLEAWLDILLNGVPALREAGWEVEVAEDFPIRLAEPEGELAAELRPEQGSGIDWFDLHLGVTVAGERLDLVPLLVALIAGGGGAALREAAATEPDGPEGPDRRLCLPLPDGRYLPLPLRQLRPLVLALEEVFAAGGAAEDGRFRFGRQDAAALAALEEGSGLAWQGGEQLRALGRQLRVAGGAIPPVALPPGFAGALRPYQAQGVAWLQFLREAGFGGVLADDMGLGKTVQTLAHLAVEQAAGRLDRPALIVCPTSLIPNWLMEAARFAPMLRVLPLHGAGRKARFAEIGAHDLVLTTYPLLARDHAVLTAQEWHVVVLDEAQAIRNPEAETTRRARALRARQRIGLSGTPLQNHLGELWSLFNFLAPGFLGDARAFRSRYRTPIEKHGDAGRQAVLHRRVRPFLLRRTKEEVAAELPPKTEITEPVELGEAQRAIYEGIRLSMHAKVQAAIAERGLARSGIVILDALLKLRQACCDPRLLPMASARAGRTGSAKLDRLMELLPVLLAEGRRVLVFSQFTSMLALIEARLREGGIHHLLLTGETQDRATPVRRFQAGEVPVFLISLKAGGVGLTLTAADTVIHYDPWWNPAVEEQATDRAHRIGQDKAVFVHRLVALGTVEEKMAVLKERKRALVDAVLAAEAGGALALTEADIEALFTPA